MKFTEKFKFINLLTVILLIACSERGNQEINKIGELYVKDAYQLGHYIKDYVDFYFGPEYLKSEPDTTITKEEVLNNIRSSIDSTIMLLNNLNYNNLSKSNRTRYKFLDAHLLALKTKIKMELGEYLTFDDEYKNIFSAEAPHFKDSYLLQLKTELDSILPGDGDLTDRYYTFIRQFTIPFEQLEDVYSTVLTKTKSITSQHIDLFEGDTCLLIFEQDMPWDAYSSYLKNGNSTIKVNIGYTKHIKSAEDLACHEAYPGHHVHTSLWDKYLYKKKGWVEFSIGVIYSPSYLIYEGIAEYAKHVVFPDSIWTNYQKQVLFPLAGLDSSDVDKYNQVADTYRLIQWGSIIEGSRRYLDGDLNKDEIVKYFVEHSLKSPDEVINMLPVIEYYRSYLVNYHLGKRIIEDYVVQNGGGINIENRWDIVFDIMTSPYLPSDLK